MKRSYLFILAAVLLFLAACSSDNDLAAIPTLEPQFGTTDYDIGVDVATATLGRTYVLSSHAGPLYDEGSQVGDYQTITLRRYNATGNVVWTRDLDTQQRYDRDSYYFYDWIEAYSVLTDASGNAFALTSSSSVDFNGYDVTHTGYSVRKYSSTGTDLASVTIGNGIEGVEGGDSGTATFAVDRYGSIFSGGIQCEYIYDQEYASGGDCAYYVSKHSSQGDYFGELFWQRPSTVGIPYGITVTGAGNVYVIGSKGLARYNSTGNVVWTKTGSNYAVGQYSKIVASGTNLYVRNEKTVRKYDANGKLLWSKPQSGLNGLVFGDMTADANGNVYIAGKYQKSAGQYDVFSRKLRPTGAILWTKTFGTPQYDDGRGIATLNGSEIYVTGETQGSLAHSNYGGSDGYLRKLNNLGNQVWIR